MSELNSMTARRAGHTEGGRLRTIVPAVHCEMTKNKQTRKKTTVW